MAHFITHKWNYIFLFWHKLRLIDSQNYVTDNCTKRGDLQIISSTCVHWHKDNRMILQIFQTSTFNFNIRRKETPFDFYFLLKFLAEHLFRIKSKFIHIFLMNRIFNELNSDWW